MGFFRKNKGAPLSAIMYQGDNTTPARREGKNATLTGTIEEDPAAPASNKKQGLFKRKNKQKERYVKVTPDRKGTANRTDEQQEQEVNEKTTLLTPPKISGAVESTQLSQDLTNDSIPALINESDLSIPALMIPNQYDSLPPTPDEKMEDTKRNLSAAFEDSYEADELEVTNHISNTAAPKDDKKFLKRFRPSWRKSPTKVKQRAMAQKLIEQQDKQDSPVPKVVIDRSDERSVPSLITEMTGQESLRKAAAAAAGSKEKASFGTDGLAEEQIFFGPAESFSTTSKNSRQPRQELTLGQKFLSLLQCGEDTTDGYFGRIKCLDLCGPSGENDMLRLEKEEDARFVLQFMNVSLLLFDLLY